jgi:hypothetical protein
MLATLKKNRLKTIMNVKPHLCLYGNLETGKSTHAQYLIEHHGYDKHSFAGGVRDLTNEVLSVMTGLHPEASWEYFFQNPEQYAHFKNNDIVVNDEVIVGGGHRKMLQGVGNGCRDIIGKNVWVDALHNKLSKGGYIEVGKQFVIDDCRYPNEAQAMQNTWKALVIYLEKPGSDGEHPSEWCEKYVKDGLVNPDFTIPYSLGIEQTACKIKEIIDNYA